MPEWKSIPVFFMFPYQTFTIQEQTETVCISFIKQKYFLHSAGCRETHGVCFLIGLAKGVNEHEKSIALREAVYRGK